MIQKLNKKNILLDFKLYTFNLVNILEQSLIKGVKDLSMQYRIYQHLPKKELSLNLIA